MKRKGSDFLGFFGGVTGNQTITANSAGWIVDFVIATVANTLSEKVAGREVPSLWPGFRWIYWVPREDYHTALLFLDEIGHPLWCYFDIICGSGEDELGFPWTDAAYLDIVALCEVRKNGM